MPPTYTRRIDKPTGFVYIDPETGIPTKGVPALGLTDAGDWVPFYLNSDGAVVIATSMQGVPYFDDVIADVDPGVEQLLIDQVVPALTTRMISQVIISTRVTGVFWITVDGAIIGSGRTGPGGSPFMPFTPPRPIDAGSEYQVRFTSRLNAPVQSVECYVQASDIAQ